MAADRLAALPVSIDEVSLRRHEMDVSSGFSRVTTVFELHGEGERGRGEDVTYEGELHEPLHEDGLPFEIPDAETVGDVSAALGEQDLFGGIELDRDSFRQYRRWGIESAALDLALRQAETDLGSVLDRPYDPVRFVVSTRLDEPPTGDRVERWLDMNADLEFKLDPTSAWPPAVFDRLAATDAVRILDLKGQYKGTTVDQPADPELYERVRDTFPDALIEDPAITDDTRPILDAASERVTWDYPIDGIESIHALPWQPKWLNIKPSRFGSIRSLFDTIEYCLDNDIRMFGGGQFELGIGREHLHTLASLFYPASPNDVAPQGYNAPEPADGLPESPLTPPSDPQGLSWSE